MGFARVDKERTKKKEGVEVRAVGKRPNEESGEGMGEKKQWNVWE